MDWTKQTDDLIKTWTGAQQRMMDAWLGAMQGFKVTQVSETYQKSLEAWKTEVHRALDAQLKWAQTWSDSVNSTSSAVPQMGEMSKQMLDTMKRWTETQSDLWDRWFEAAQKVDPSALNQLVKSEDAQKVIQTWQDAAQKALDAQSEWVRLFSGAKKD